jgi:DNA replication protein DnaC
LELARGEWIRDKFNTSLVGSTGTGKTHLAIALGQAACRQGYRVAFFTAAQLVTELEKAQKQYTCRIRPGRAQLFRSGGTHLSGCGANRLGMAYQGR